MNKNSSIAAALGAIAIMLGAFASHSLEESLSLNALKSLETAVRYQMYHVLAVLILNLLSRLSASTKNLLSLIFFFGILCFSGSIYAIYLLGIPAKTIWFVTPLGGVLFIVGWLWLSIRFLTNDVKNSSNNL